MTFVVMSAEEIGIGQDVRAATSNVPAMFTRSLICHIHADISCHNIHVTPDIPKTGFADLPF